MKKCIFHYPGPLVANPVVGSEVRPAMMLKAFRDLGYEVDVISGYSQERKGLIKKVKENIEAGTHYDFLYSESTTMPTALSDRDHLPRNPFLDEQFFSYCRKKKIPVGLFYRDAYWRFSYYRERVKKWVPYVTIPFYEHELGRYRYCTDTLFVPSNEFAEAIGYQAHYRELPSGGRLVAEDSSVGDSEQLRLFYVGGITGINNIDLVVDTIRKSGNAHLTICCPTDQLEECDYLKHIAEESDNIRIIHETGEGVIRNLRDADIALALFDRNPYRDLAMPVKLFEYIGAGKPIISTAGTAAGRYVEEKGAGWAIEYSADKLEELLQIVHGSDELAEKKAAAAELAKQNTWQSRAETVAEELMSRYNTVGD